MMKRKMMNVRFKQGYGKAVTAMALILALGAVLGAFLVIIIDEDMLLNSKTAIELLNDYGIFQVDNIEAFGLAFKSNVKTLFILWVMGFSLFFVPIIFCAVLVKGISIGFSTAAFAKISGIKGLFQFGLLTIARNMILIPVIVFIAVLSIQSAIKLKKAKKSENSIEKKNIIRQKGIILIAILIVSFICGIIESCFVTSIMPLIL